MDTAKSFFTGKEAGSLNPLQLLAVLRSAGGALAAQASLHAQLAQVEWEEEKQRLCKMLIFTLVGFACFLCFLLFAGVLAIAVSWNTPYRLPVLISLVIGHAAVLIWVAFRLKALAALSHESFAATRAEIAADLALIKSAL